MNRKILFVDDEPMLLSGLRRSFHANSYGWSTEFVSSAAEALAILERGAIDAVVTDMRMPGMDGAQLLDEVRKRSPQTIRMVLSGQSDRETVLRSISPAHQYISKPCDTELLKSKIERAFALRDLLDNSELRAVISQMKTIPSLPVLYMQIMEEINSPAMSLARVGRIVAQDLGMTAKILQIVNSAFFGLRWRISSAQHAVELLGLDIVKSIILSVHVFSQFDVDSLREQDMLWLRAHSFHTSILARRIAKHEQCSSAVVDDSFTAGLLHDIGKLILASSVSAKYAAVLNLVDEESVPLYEAELRVLGCTHAEAGAYLLGVWGLPGPIVEAVAWHHSPAHISELGFSPLTAVHAASCYDEEWCPSRIMDGRGLDTAFLEKLGLGGQEHEWRQTCKELMEEGKANDK